MYLDALGDPSVASYIDWVTLAGGVYIISLPGNTNLGKGAAGAAGARFQDSTAPRGWRYELAPPGIQSIVNGHAYADFQTANGNGGKIIDAVESITTPLAELTGLDHGALGVVAKLLGIPFPLAVVLVLFIGYAVLRQYKIVPSLSAVVK